MPEASVAAAWARELVTTASATLPMAVRARVEAAREDGARAEGMAGWRVKVEATPARVVAERARVVGTGVAAGRKKAAAVRVVRAEVGMAVGMAVGAAPFLEGTVPEATTAVGPETAEAG